MAASLIAINFVLFAEAGSYSIFTGAQQLNTEAMYILAAVFGLCFLISYLCSFSKFLQNLFTTSIFALFLLAVFNQFALFDKESVLSNVISTDGELGVLLSTGSHLVLTGILSLIFLIFLMSAGRLTQTYLLGILLFILGAVGTNPLAERLQVAEAVVDKQFGRHIHNDKVSIVAAVGADVFCQKVESLKGVGNI